MKRYKLIKWFFACISVYALVFTSGLAFSATSYTPGFVWDRSIDWTPGIVPGSSIGNPDDDKLGNATWMSEYVTGGGLGSLNPWYAQPGNLMVWDNEWWPAHFGVWARGYAGVGDDNNLNPPVTQYGMAHDISSTYGSWGYVPIVKWINPVGDGAILNIFGNADLIWEGTNGGPDLNFEISIARHHVNGVVDLLYSNSFSNPNPSVVNRPFPKISIPISLDAIRFNSGDQLSFSARLLGGPLNTNDTKWGVFGDDFKLQLVSVVPEPSTWLLMVVGLIYLLGWRSVKARGLLRASKSLRYEV